MIRPATAFAAVLAPLLFASSAVADRRPHSLSTSFGERDWGEQSGSEAVGGIQARLGVTSLLSLRFGEEIICVNNPACTVLGFHGVGLIVHPLGGAIRPYAYGALSIFVHGAHFLDDEARPYNLGLHWSTGVGVETDLGNRFGAYLEAGLLGDASGELVAPTATAGVSLRFGSSRPW